MEEHQVARAEPFLAGPDADFEGVEGVEADRADLLARQAVFDDDPLVRKAVAAADQRQEEPGEGGQAEGDGRDGEEFSQREEPAA